MNESSSNSLSSRREFIKTTGRIAAVSALAGVTLPQVHAASSDTIQVALIGCGGRGTGAAANALATNGGTVKLVAMADVFENRLNGSYWVCFHSRLHKNEFGFSVIYRLIHRPTTMPMPMAQISVRMSRQWLSLWLALK